MSTSLVIAQYNENLSWIKNINKKYVQNIHIYTKNSNNIEEIFHQDIPVHRVYLPNKGREAHTYLYHIIDQYKSLDDFTFFVQGYPTTLTLEDINKNIANTQYTSNFDTVNYLWLNPYHKIYYWQNQKLQNTGLNFFRWYYKFIDQEPLLYPYHIYWEANFGVSKEKILSRNIEYYKNLIDQLSVNNMEATHFMERSWFYIFNLHRGV